MIIIDNLVKTNKKLELDKLEKKGNKLMRMAMDLDNVLDD